MVNRYKATLLYLLSYAASNEEANELGLVPPGQAGLQTLQTGTKKHSLYLFSYAASNEEANELDLVSPGQAGLQAMQTVTKPPMYQLRGLQRGGQ
jgi:hypothetical protein